MGYQLGVDLGTTFTAAAVRRGDVVTMLGLGNRALQVPSVLYLQPNGSWLVGEAAEARAAAEPDRIAREFKRRIGDPVPIIVAGTPFSAELLTARLLSWVVRVATEREGGSPEAVTVSYPANWGNYKTDLLRQAFALADLPDVATCTEPEAAAITYATRQRVPDGAYVAVYDLGGGTFDAAVLRHTGDRFALVGRAEGIEHLGGVDFDEAVFQHVMRSLGAELAQVDADDPAVIRGLERLRRDCVVAKESLSVDTEALLSVAIGRVDTVVRLTRGEFEDMVRPALGETVAALQRVLRSADIEADQLAAILLVGGSSRIPLVSEVLSAAFGRPLALDAHPKHEVAMGAAWLSGPLPQPELASAAPSGTGNVAAAPTDRLTRAHEPDPTRGLAGNWWHRRRAWIAGIAAAVVVAVVVAAVLLAGGGNSGGTSANGHGQSTAAPPSSPSLSKSVVDLAATRPEGPALRDNVILWTATHGGHDEIWAANADRSGAHRLLPIEDVNFQVLSHDRRTIAYQRGSAVWIAASDGSGARPLFQSTVPPCVPASRPSFNKNDTAVAILCGTSDRSSLYLFDLSGKYLTKRPLVTGHLGDVTFGVNGQLAFWRICNGPGRSQLAMIAATAPPGTAPTALTGCIGSNDPSFSPDGKSIVFTVWTGSNADVYVESLATRKLRRLTNSPVPDQDPSWSPSGTQVAYKHGPIRNADIWMVNVADDRTTALTEDDVPDTVPSWSTR